MGTKSNAETPRFASKKRFFREAVKQEERRTSFKSASSKARGLGYLRDKETGWSETWGKVIGGRKKVK